MPRKCNQAGLNLIKAAEGLRLHSYQDSVGIWTIGYGHTAGVTAGQTITEAQAEEFLARDLEHTETAIECMVKVPLTDNQFSALCSLVFNIGAGNFKGSTCLRRLNEEDYFAAANWILPWDRAGGVELDGLRDRRNAERKLFLTPDAEA